MLADFINTDPIMENCDKIKTKSDGRRQWFLYTNSSFETSEEEHSSLNKRRKLCSQNRFWMDTTREFQENLNSESGKSLLTNERNSCTFSNDAYLCDVKTVSPGPSCSDTGSTFQNPQVYARRPPEISFDKQCLDFPKEKCYFEGRKQHVKESTSKYVESVVLTPKVYKHFTLYPPENGIIPKVEQLPGCKTVVISGLPHILKYHSVKPMFRHCGKSQQIRTVEKGVFQITFVCQKGVDNAIRLNGYKVGGFYKDVTLTGTIKIEFANIWLEKHGFNWGKMPYPRYSEESVKQLIYDIEQDRIIEQCVNVFIFWLEEEQCTESNCRHFFLVLKAIHDLVSRCISEANKFDEFVRKNYCNQILKAFTLACSETVLDNLDQFKNQVVKWKQFIEEINRCKSWETVSAIKKVKLEPSAQQESITSNPLSNHLLSPKKINHSLKNLIKLLEKDRVPNYWLNRVVYAMEKGKCTKFIYDRYFIALETMYGFISRFTSDQTKFGELVCRGYCGMILKAFRVACSETVNKNFEKSVYENKIKKWKEYIEEINKCKSWEVFVNRKIVQKMAQSGILLTENDQLNVDLQVAETMTYNNQNSDIQDHQTANLNNENNIDHNDAGNFKRENNNMNNETSNHNNENDTENNKDAGYKQVENDIPNNETVSHNNETVSHNNETDKQSNESDIPNNETVRHYNETGKQSNENDIPNNETVSHNNETGKQIDENDIQNKDTTCNQNNENIIQNNESNNQNKKNGDSQSDIGVNLVEKEARLIAALGGFLHLRSIGATIGDICKYLLKIDPTITCQGIEDLMRKFPALFMEQLTDDNSLITKWTILGM